ncbi:hypothetical protein DEO72_LG9g1601 [Vigna unguiculata]|uniref:Uncharacterized protein n=1 Tax=Vigna unguiculata TaxID=3917 RepID=A0A4D6N3J4_VIGUN|nr:hypothetical protein DEO72_LG9g1601 [Vigna unguiculata]
MKCHITKIVSLPQTLLTPEKGSVKASTIFHIGYSFSRVRVARPSERSRKPVVLYARVLVQARVFGFGRVMISPRRDDFAQARARRVPLLQASLKRGCLA